MLKMSGEFIERVQETKKGGYIRRFLAELPSGGKKLFTVYSKFADALKVEGKTQISVDVQDFVFVRDQA